LNVIAAAAPASGPALPLRASVLISVTVCAAVVVAVAAVGTSPLHSSAGTWTALALMTVLGMAAERHDINVYGDGRVSVSALFMVTGAVLFGPVAAPLMCPLVGLAAHVGRDRPAYKFVFNTAVFVLATTASALAFTVLSRAVPGDSRPAEAVAVIGAALAHFGVSSALVACIIGATGAATGAVSPRRVWAEKFAWLVPHFVVLGALAFLLALAYRAFAGYGVVAFTLPVLMTRFTMKQYVDRTERTVYELRRKNTEVEQLSEELSLAYNETLAALVSALDARDVETHGHSQRVAELSLDLAAVLGIAPGSREWAELERGALLHDVGKIGVPDAVLRKQGPLTPAEWDVIRTHPMQGYRMLSAVRFLEPAAELVLAHHERFDGKGYPRGLRGDEIPLGARIFAVADAYDAITSDRPYKSARTDAEARAEIARGAGTQFDPRVVEALLAIRRPRAA
jgi:hypothetical protein